MSSKMSECIFIYITHARAASMMLPNLKATVIYFQSWEFKSSLNDHLDLVMQGDSQSEGLSMNFIHNAEVESSVGSVVSTPLSCTA